MRRLITMTALCVAMAGAGCTFVAVASNGTRQVSTSENALVTGPFIAAGSQLRIRLEQTLDTQVSRGSSFTAAVLQPVYDSTGRILIAEGARLQGQVVSTLGASGKRLRVRLDRVDTVLGPAPIHARIDASEHVEYPGVPRLVAPDAFAFGGGPGSYRWGDSDWSVYVPREVNLPAGAVMNLTLTRPLVAPGGGALAR